MLKKYSSLYDVEKETLGMLCQNFGGNLGLDFECGVI